MNIVRRHNPRIDRRSIYIEDNKQFKQLERFICVDGTIDEDRRKYTEYILRNGRFDDPEKARGSFEELWTCACDEEEYTKFEAKNAALLHHPSHPMVGLGRGC
ncbi:MAG: hypothetical protein V3V61_07115 [Gammaproteobacteria bacterium]